MNLSKFIQLKYIKIYNAMGSLNRADSQINPKHKLQLWNKSLISYSTKSNFQNHLNMSEFHEKNSIVLNMPYFVRCCTQKNINM